VGAVDRRYENASCGPDGSQNEEKMIDEVYGKYRQGLVEEREQILDYLGEDYLALEELRTYFPERYRRRMAVEEAV